MKKFLAISAFTAGMFFSGSAMAVHQCGQLLGSCLPEIDTPVIIITPPVEIEAVRPVIRAVPAAKLKCYKTVWAYGQWVTVQPLREIPCQQ